MELGMDFTQLTIDLGKRQIEPSIKEVERLKAQIISLQKEVKQLKQELYRIEPEGILNKKSHNLYEVDEITVKMKELEDEQVKQRKWTEIERI